MPVCSILITCCCIQETQTPGYCLKKEMCLQVITKAALWMFACIFRIRRLERKMTERYREEREQKGGGNGKCRLFVSVHLAQFTTNASIWHGLHLSCERQRSFYVGWKRKHIGLRRMVNGVCSSLQLCFCDSGKRRVSDVLQLLHTWMVVDDYLTHVAYVL